MTRNKYLLTRDGYRLFLRVEPRNNSDLLVSLTMVCIESGTTLTVVPATRMHLDWFQIFQWIRDAGMPRFDVCRRRRRSPVAFHVLSNRAVLM